MKIKTSELTGSALDWAVAKCEGFYNFDATGRPFDADKSNPCDDENGCCWFQPSTDWTQGGPIIEREGFTVEPFKGRSNKWACFDFEIGNVYYGDTPLIAAMRCYVASKLCDEVEVPD